MPIIESILSNLPNLPSNSKMVNDNGKISFDREKYDNSIYDALSSLTNRYFESFLYNPDFNILGAGGYTPITQASGSDIEVVSNWYLINDGGFNNFTVTPKAYTSVNKSPSGSLNYLNIAANVIDEPLYIYNLNYSTGVQQFNSASKYNDQLLTISIAYRNNTEKVCAVAVEAFISTVGKVDCPVIYLEPSRLIMATQLKIPDLRDIDLGPSPNVQFRFYLQQENAEPIDVDLFYIKGEIGDTPTALQFDHIIEQLRCQNLT